MKLKNNCCYFKFHQTMFTYIDLPCKTALPKGFVVLEQVVGL